MAAFEQTISVEWPSWGSAFLRFFFTDRKPCYVRRRHTAPTSSCHPLSQQHYMKKLLHWVETNHPGLLLWATEVFIHPLTSETRSALILFQSKKGTSVQTINPIDSPHPARLGHLWCPWRGPLQAWVHDTLQKLILLPGRGWADSWWSGQRPQLFNDKCEKLKGTLTEVVNNCFLAKQA